jgi:hypothetical protein
MRGGLLGSKSGLAVAALTLGACQTIIGISGYEIDRDLDDEGSGGVAHDGGSMSSGGKPVGGSNVDAGAGGGEVAEGGHGELPRGGSSNGSGADAGGAPGGAGGGGGCTRPADCDDDIDCTVDSCSDGTCENTPDTTLCVATNDECVTCRAGLGCVVGESMVQQLLLDPSFDESSGDWVEYSDNFDNNIFVEAGAQSGTSIARFGPAPLDAAAREYADLFQYVTIPEHTVSLTFSGHYQLAPGPKKPAAEYVVAGLYEIGAVDPYTEFHSWAGNSGARAAWTAFSYDADQSDIQSMWGVEYTFDLVARTWDSVYRFDSLSLTATVCE